MDKKKLMLLLGAMVIAIGTALAARSMLSGSSAPTAQAAMILAAPKGPRVLVAQRALPVGTIITADAIQYQAWPKDMVQQAYFIDGNVNMNKLIGTVVRYPVTAGQPLTQGALVAPGDRGFLAAALGPGMRAMTITVSEKSGVAGFIFPGDHVDLMLTQAVKANSTLNAGPMHLNDQRDLNATETILRNLRVLATDQSTESETANGKTVVHTAHTVTLEVTPRIAEKIEVAQSAGALSLTLRSIADNQSELDKAIASGSIKLPDNASKADTDKLLDQVSKQPIEGKTTFATGGDVSRFQRRDLPNTFASVLGSMGAPARSGQVAVFRPNDTVRVTRGHDTTAVALGAGGLPVTTEGSQPATGGGLPADGIGNAGRALGSGMQPGGM